MHRQIESEVSLTSFKISATKEKTTLNSFFQKEKKVLSWEEGKSNKKFNAREERQEMQLPWKPEHK